MRPKAVQQDLSWSMAHQEGYKDHQEQGKLSQPLLETVVPPVIAHINTQKQTKREKSRKKQHGEMKWQPNQQTLSDHFYKMLVACSQWKGDNLNWNCWRCSRSQIKSTYVPWPRQTPIDINPSWTTPPLRDGGNVCIGQWCSTSTKHTNKNIKHEEWH